MWLFPKHRATSIKSILMTTTNFKNFVFKFQLTNPIIQAQVKAHSEHRGPSQQALLPLLTSTVDSAQEKLGAPTGAT